MARTIYTTGPLTDEQIADLYALAEECGVGSPVPGSRPSGPAREPGLTDPLAAPLPGTAGPNEGQPLPRCHAAQVRFALTTASGEGPTFAGWR